MTRDQATEFWRLRDALHRIDVAMRAADAATIANVAKRVEVVADDAERPATAWAPGMRVRDLSDGDEGVVTSVDDDALFILWGSCDFSHCHLIRRDGTLRDIEVIR